MIEVKILTYHSAQRYAVRQILVAAQRELQKEVPSLQLRITELKDWFSIEKYTPVISAACLVVDEKLVCVGRVSSRQEVMGWLRTALGE